MRRKSYEDRNLLGVAEARGELAQSKVKQTSMQEEIAVLEKQLEEHNKVFMCVASVSV